MGVLIGLEGISAKEIECKYIGKPSSIRKILRDGLAGTDAGDNGAINVWRDDSKVIRGSAHVHLKTVESKKFKNLIETEKWISKWQKRIN